MGQPEYTLKYIRPFLSNVDWLHGGAESLLTLTNLFIVLGLRRALRRAKDEEESSASASQSERESYV
ncbi:hypothetical protein MLD38_015585 [Melastoma candidum]|uniref:Uncharacterized protein n=1 Tax=Melastoma candidum TaxID=119954 RepID=A0ACB9RGQ2_9MYRT|nr:hypothetical protein MLD38_015585 [Melastoma candidum]